MAEPSLRRTAPLQDRAGARPARPHRQDRVARRPPLPRLGRDAVLPQQVGIHLRTAPLDDLRGDRRRRRHRRRPRAGIPYPQPLRQGARHRKVLVAARAVERAAQRDQALRARTRLFVPQHPRARGADAQPHRPHRLDGRDHGHRRIRRRGHAPHRSADEPRRGTFSSDHVALLRGQHQVERLAGRPHARTLPRQGPYLRTDGGAAFQGGPQIVLPDQFGAGLRTLQGGARLRGAHRRRDALRPLHRHGHHRQLLRRTLCQGRGRGVRPRSDRRREGQFGAQRHRQHALLRR